MKTGLTYDLLRTLESISPLYCDTPSLVESHLPPDKPNRRQIVWMTLSRLRRDGLVESKTVNRVTHWRSK